MTSRVRRVNRELTRCLIAMLILLAMVWGVRSGALAAAGEAIGRLWLTQVTHAPPS